MTIFAQKPAARNLPPTKLPPAAARPVSRRAVPSGERPLSPQTDSPILADGAAPPRAHAQSQSGWSGRKYDVTPVLGSIAPGACRPPSRQQAGAPPAATNTMTRLDRPPPDAAAAAAPSVPCGGGDFMEEPVDDAGDFPAAPPRRRTPSPPAFVEEPVDEDPAASPAPAAAAAPGAVPGAAPASAAPPPPARAHRRSTGESAGLRQLLAPAGSGRAACAADACAAAGTVTSLGPAQDPFSAELRGIYEDIGMGGTRPGTACGGAALGSLEELLAIAAEGEDEYALGMLMEMGDGGGGEAATSPALAAYDF